MGGAAPAAGLIVAVVVLGAVVWYLTHKAPPGTKISEFTDQFITLQKGQSAQGIVFFVTPQGSAGIDRATLRVPFAHDSLAATPRRVVTVQLTALEVLTFNPTGGR